MAERRPRLEGKVAIITGAGSSGTGIGNGKATAVLFAREGAKVLLVDALIERAEETLIMIRDEGGEASVFQADVTKASDCQGMVEAAVEHYGRLDILDNNVGISRGETVVDVSEEQWDQIMTVNVKSVMLASKYAIPKMIEGGGGAIINMSSIAGMRALSRTPYSASKGAIIALTKSMAADHGRDNIRVNTIAPGLVYTPMVAPRMTEEVREERRLASPLQTEGTAWDVAWAAVYLASDEARWVTGVVLPIDAGLTITTPATFHKMAHQVYQLPPSS